MEKSIGGIWEKEGKKGTFLSISIEDADGNKTSYVAFKNDYKKPGDRTPDYKVFASQPRRVDPNAPDENGDIPF